MRNNSHYETMSTTILLSYPYSKTRSGTTYGRSLALVHRLRRAHLTRLLILLPPSPIHIDPAAAARPSQQRNPTSRLGNLVAYHTVSEAAVSPTTTDDDGMENDSPSYSKAMKGADRTSWLQTMSKEFSSLQAHGVGTLVEAPSGANILPGMWRLKRKRDEFGKITTYKARWVAGGNHQVQGIDFESTYASVGLTDTLRTLYSLAAVDDLEMQSFDIETAFLNGTMSHDVYVRQVTGFRDHSRPNHVWRLNKSLYGTCQAHREFNADLDSKLKNLGFTPSPVDNSLYTLREGSKFIHITMHVDDGMTFSNDSTFLQKFQRDIQESYNVKWNENPSLHLGIHITRDRKQRTIHLDQEHYCKAMLKRFGLTTCNSVKTPLPQNVHLYTPTIEESEEIEQYRAAVGMLNFLSIQTRPDIAYSVSYLARFNSRHNSSHWTAVKHLLRFVKGTTRLGLDFGTRRGNNTLIEGYADADYAGDVDTRRSTTGFVYFVRGSLVSWKSRRQPSVTLSTTEAEYLAIGDCAKHGLWLSRLLEHIIGDVTVAVPIQLPLSNDNQGAVFLCNEASVNNKSKHIAIRHHFIRELVRDGRISVSHVSTKGMPADVLTKAVGPIVMDSCIGQLGLSTGKSC